MAPGWGSEELYKDVTGFELKAGKSDVHVLLTKSSIPLFAADLVGWDAKRWEPAPWFSRAPNAFRMRSGHVPPSILKRVEDRCASIIGKRYPTSYSFATTIAAGNYLPTHDDDSRAHTHIYTYIRSH